jgi:hypothetical protein
MLAMLQIVIGILFVMLLFSLLASTIMEFIAGFLSLRGRQLARTIQNMIGSETGKQFVRHPFFQQLAIGSNEHTSRFGKRSVKLPSYLNSSTFSSVLLDVLELDAAGELEAKINAMDDGPLKKVMQFLYKQTGGDLLAFKTKMEEWFNEVMDRSSGYYKRNSQRWLFSIGLAIALIFNADAIMVYHNLSVNSTLRETVEQTATSFMNSQPPPASSLTDYPNLDESRKKIGALVNENIAALESPLGLGWSAVKAEDMNIQWWLYKIIGWLTTALAISLGATFWFDMLKKIINIRAAGPAPASVPMTTTIFTQTAPAPVQTVVKSSGLTQPEPSGGFESVKRSPSKARKKPSSAIKK